LIKGAEKLRDEENREKEINEALHIKSGVEHGDAIEEALENCQHCFTQIFVGKGWYLPHPSRVLIWSRYKLGLSSTPRICA
jgi:hypothetical protein